MADRVWLGVQLGINGAGPFGRRPEEDLPGVLAILAAIGYDGAEIHLNVFYAGAVAVKRAFADQDLAVTALHVFDEDVLDASGRRSVLDAALTAGAPRVIVTAHTLLRPSADGPPPAERFRAVSAMLTGLAHEGASVGVGVYYHPHHIDFWRLADEEGRGLDLLHRETTGLKVAIDTYWAHVGGADPAEVIVEFGDRCDYLHIRDGDKRRSSPLGVGEVPLEPALRALARRADQAAWLVYEDAHPRLPPTALCLAAKQYLAERGFTGESAR